MTVKKIKKTKEPIVLTREESIKQALVSKQKSYFSRGNESPFSIIPEVPTNRYVKIGDKVQIGNLTDCVVAFVSVDRKFIVVDYTNVNNNYGNPIHTPAIGCWVWVDVFLLTNIEETELIPNYNSSRDNWSTGSIDGLLMKTLYFGTNSNPTYQRGYVWTEEDEVRLIDSVFNGSDIGKFIFLKYEWPVTDVDVLDGKQRLNTLVRFITSQFKYKGLYWHQISRSDRSRFEDRTVQYAELDAKNFTEADKLRLFLRVNAAGVPQDESHLSAIKQRLAELEE